jgi:hypothetical protein
MCWWLERLPELAGQGPLPADDLLNACKGPFPGALDCETPDRETPDIPCASRDRGLPNYRLAHPLDDELVGATVSIAG